MTWKLPDGSWLPLEGLTDPDRGGQAYLISMNDELVYLNDKGLPVTARNDADGEAIPYLILEDGDVADCLSVSNLWEPEIGDPYAYDAALTLGYDSATEKFIDPPPLTLDDLGPDAFALSDGRLVDDCTLEDMPERTSQAHYDFVYSGADAGAGYGRGGQSHAGMMPGFGSSLPPDLIQAVVDHERGL